MFLDKNLVFPGIFQVFHHNKELGPEVKSVQKELQKHGLGTEEPPLRFAADSWARFSGPFSIIRKLPVFSLFGNFFQFLFFNGAFFFGHLTVNSSTCESPIDFFFDGAGWNTENLTVTLPQTGFTKIETSKRRETSAAAYPTNRPDNRIFVGSTYPFHAIFCMCGLRSGFYDDVFGSVSLVGIINLITLMHNHFSDQWW